MTATLLLLAVLVCTNANSPYEVRAEKGAAGTYDHVTLLSSPDLQVAGDYTHYVDTTPPPPTDLLFRYIFSDDPVPSDGYSVTLAAGGFTDATTALVQWHSTTGSGASWGLTCR